MSGRICTSCKLLKEITCFYVHKSGEKAGKPYSHCKDCKAIQQRENRDANKKKDPDYYNRQSRNWRRSNPDRNSANFRKSQLKRNFGITSEEYESMAKNQNDRCLVCGAHRDSLKRDLAVDHCHITGKVRGLLCSRCNTGIGLLKDSPEVLKSALRYLENGK
jgi:hypothetical protein